VLHSTYKKLQVSSAIALFLLLAIMPTINADISSKNQDNIIDMQKNEKKDSLYKLLILAPDEFINDLEPLVIHKEEMYLSTNLISLSEVYEDMDKQGRDEPEKIKYYIKSAIEEWGIEYVLLVGGKKGQLPFWHFPVRYAYMECDWESKILTDLYFADVYDSSGNFSSWDSDKDGIFGEWYMEETPEDINIDFYPDVAIGRLPCRNRFEVKIMVNKIIDYEKNTFNQSWFNDIIAFAGDTYPEIYNPNWTGYEGEYYADLALENMTNFNHHKYYTSDGTLTGPADVRNALNNGCGFVYFVGHGSPQTWGNNLPNSDKFVRGLTTQNVFLLQNNHKYPISVLSGCHDLQFDVSIFRFFNTTTRYHMEGTPECLGWRLTRKIGGGSIATLGCTALGFTKEDKATFDGGINELEVEFFKQYGQNGIDVLGDTWKGAINWYIDTYPVNWASTSFDDSWVDGQVTITWILFGDPSLKIGGYP